MRFVPKRQDSNGAFEARTGHWSIRLARRRYLSAAALARPLRLANWPSRADLSVAKPSLSPGRFWHHRQQLHQRPAVLNTIAPQQLRTADNSNFTWLSFTWSQRAQIALLPLGRRNCRFSGGRRAKLSTKALFGRTITLGDRMVCTCGHK